MKETTISGKYTYSQVLEASLKYFNDDMLAAKIWVDKYALKDKEDNYCELTPEDMHRRLAKEFARIEKSKFKKPLTEDEIFNYFDRFKYIVPQGSPMFGIGNPFQIVSLSNCFVVPDPIDSYGGILHTDQQITHIYKRRGGCGLDVSNLRPKGYVVKNAAGTSSGAVSFMSRFSNTTREVCQEGRRGALMLTMSVHHPDILEFIKCKQNSDKITGANISVRVTDEFMNAVIKNTTYEQRFPVDSKKPAISKQVSAKQIWNELIKSAHAFAEPGILFWDNILKNSPADSYKSLGFSTTCTNPCCFSKNYLVLVQTKSGLKEIKTITKDDLIWIDYKKTWAKTSGYFDAGKAVVYKVIFNNAVELVITANHKLMNSDYNLTELKNLKVGDKILVDSTAKQVDNFTTIEKIEKLGIEEVGCIEVETYHSFTANDIISGNSELPLAPLDSCRLLLLNLYSYVDNPFTNKACFNYTKFYEHSKIAQRLMDDMIDLELECINKIINKIESDPESKDIKQIELDLWKQIKFMCSKGRRTGTGITALGDTLAALNMKYGSKESINEVDKLYKVLKLGCYRSSVDMAREIGPFNIWNSDLEKDNEFLLRLKKDDATLYNDMQKYGRRNISLLTTAPAGTVSNLTQTSSGIEPVFQLSYIRRKKINSNDKNSKIDFKDQNGDSWQEFIVYHPKLKEWMKITGETDLKKSPWYGCCAEELSWEDRVLLQSKATAHTDHAISSTINLPENTTIDKVAEIYEMAHKLGCKGMTVYRKNCRTGVLIDNKPKEIKLINKTTAPKRPKQLTCDIYTYKVKGKNYFVCVGLLGNDPYELFAGECDFSKQNEKGFITKIKRGYYQITSLSGDILIKDTNKTLTSDEEAITRLISTSLRHGADVSFVTEQLEKVEGDLSSLAKIISRSLKHYIQNGTKVHGEECPNCKNQLVRASGCSQCISCGWSKCS